MDLTVWHQLVNKTRIRNDSHVSWEVRARFHFITWSRCNELHSPRPLWNKHPHHPGSGINITAFWQSQWPSLHLLLRVLSSAAVDGVQASIVKPCHPPTNTWLLSTWSKSPKSRNSVFHEHIHSNSARYFVVVGGYDSCLRWTSVVQPWTWGEQSTSRMSSETRKLGRKKAVHFTISTRSLSTVT